MKKLLYSGSVKNVYSSGDDIEFEFSDKYSIYDWGAMPDLIPHKGKNLALTAALLFEKLHSATTFKDLKKPKQIKPAFFDSLISSDTYNELSTDGAKTHYQKYLPPNSILVNKVDILHPTQEQDKYNYQAYQSAPTKTLIPLEVVFRLGVPDGSSLLKRDKTLIPNSMFEQIKVEFYTKLEPIDRLLSSDEAVSMAALTTKELEQLTNLTKIYALVLENLFTKSQLTFWDGKFEFAFGEKINGHREIVLVDSIGPDEIRLTQDKKPLSKEYLRSLYFGSDWYEELERVKKESPRDFKEKSQLAPQNLTEDQITYAENIYLTVTNTLTSKIVIFGQGGREHAIANQLASAYQTNSIFVIPGNPGIDGEKIQSIDIHEDEYLSFCKKHKVDLAVIGPEALLEKGLSDQLQTHGIACASPSQNAARLETSKAFSKTFMQKHQIPTASFANFQDSNAAIEYIKNHAANDLVIKLSGLAAGKGVIICHNKEDSIAAVKALAPNDEELVIEQFLTGPEVSYFVLCLKGEYKILGTACDYKRLKDNNEGPNTGGMGCYSPAHWLSQKDHEVIKQEVILKTLQGMKEEDINYRGVLFIGLMMTPQGPSVLEYNVRFGDPETQTILPRVEAGLFESLQAIANNDLSIFKNSLLELKKSSSIHIVKAAKGYPGTFGEKIEKGQVIKNNFTSSPSTHLFFAGVKKEQDHFVTCGGRVLGVTGLDDNLANARSLAYETLNTISFAGEQFRRDIGQ
ncbi:MAG: phosphoribosylamine--glycine ligase [Halobacteriovoraceae bacterium]|jgi:phosphoribosylamine---glycine ligase|nr:phosphoribosylamine--glycine ligase [Halobacteriovoraceae bacterium]